MKKIEVIKTVKEIKFNKTWGELEAKNCLKQIYEANSSFYLKQGTTRKVQFLLFSSFLLLFKKKLTLGGRHSASLKTL